MIAGDDAELELAFPPKPEFVRAARHAIAALARLHGADEDVVEDIKLAVSEACTVAVAERSGGDEDAVEVAARGGPEGLVVEVVDRGFTAAAAVSGSPQELDTGEMPFERALSLPIIRGLVDDVAITPRDGGGATVRMVMGLESNSAAAE